MLEARACCCSAAENPRATSSLTLMNQDNRYIKELDTFDINSAGISRVSSLANAI
jgi:hypothetical protein